MLAINSNYLYLAFDKIYEYFESIAPTYKEFSARAAFIQLKENCEVAIYNKIIERINGYMR